MRILYGVVGEGMGHATRSRVILEHLLSQGHEVKVVVSGRAHPFLVSSFAERDNISIEEIYGLHLTKEGSTISLPRTIWSNISRGPAGLWKNIKVYRKMKREGFRPDVVISDFESWAFFYALNNRIPLVSIDNQQMIPRCHHNAEIAGKKPASYYLTKWFVQAKMPGAYHYLVSSFFFPPVTHEQTTLLPPILRPEILEAKREKGSHVLVYHPATAEPETLEVLQQMPYQFKVYGSGKEGRFGNLELCPFSATQFVEDLRTARAVVAGGGFSLMCEAVHLRVPMLAIPLKDQFEQEMNARYLKQLGYGSWSLDFDKESIQDFLGQLPAYERGLRRYQPQSNQMLFGCLDEVLHSIRLAEPAPARLVSPAMGKFEGPRLPARWRRRMALAS
jgi:uncharacterized protein (TIGR00661 family)